MQGEEFHLAFSSPGHCPNRQDVNYMTLLQENFLKTWCLDKNISVLKSHFVENVLTSSGMLRICLTNYSSSLEMSIQLLPRRRATPAKFLCALGQLYSFGNAPDSLLKEISGFPTSLPTNKSTFFFFFFICKWGSSLISEGSRWTLDMMPSAPLHPFSGLLPALERVF